MCIVEVVAYLNIHAITVQNAADVKYFYLAEILGHTRLQGN